MRPRFRIFPGRSGPSSLLSVQGHPVRGNCTDTVEAFETWADGRPAEVVEPPRGVGTHETVLRGVRFQRYTSAYTLWMVQRPRDAYGALGGAEQQAVRKALAGTGLLALLDYPPRHRLGKRHFKLVFEG